MIEKQKKIRMLAFSYDWNILLIKICSSSVHLLKKRLILILKQTVGVSGKSFTALYFVNVSFQYSLLI